MRWTAVSMCQPQPPAANVAVRRYLDEGAKISREITARYTN